MHFVEMNWALTEVIIVKETGLMVKFEEREEFTAMLDQEIRQVGALGEC